MTQPPKILVLLVDDEPMVRLVAAVGLEEAGYDVVEADTAAAAFAILQARRDVGVLFTDVNMPGELDGLGLAELVHAQWPDIKLVVTSALRVEDRVPDSGRFLTKPYSFEQMTNAIRGF